MSDGAHGCVAPSGVGLLERAISCLTAPGADCGVPLGEPYYLRRPENIIPTLAGLEILATLRQWPGGTESLNETIARWMANPVACAANLQELIMRPVPTLPAVDGRPWPGQYL